MERPIAMILKSVIDKAETGFWAVEGCPPKCEATTSQYMVHLPTGGRSRVLQLSYSVQLTVNKYSLSFAQCLLRGTKTSSSIRLSVGHKVRCRAQNISCHLQGRKGNGRVLAHHLVSHGTIPFCEDSQFSTPQSSTLMQRTRRI